MFANPQEQCLRSDAMFIKEITERLARLKEELADLKEMNRRYRTKPEHSPMDKAASQTRQIRLTEIKNELEFMRRRAA
jgi:hypothetical protein